MSKATALLNGAANICIAGFAVSLGVGYLQKPQPPRVPEDWEREMTTGIAWGPTDAEVRIVEFIDMQCPFCADWASELNEILTQYPDHVQVAMHHLPPTNIHPQALDAAQAVECAEREGRGRVFMANAFRAQDRCDSSPWVDLAVESEVVDLEAFRGCLALPLDSFPRISYGMALAERNRLAGTPTVWVNGEPGVPSKADLQILVQQAIQADGP